MTVDELNALPADQASAEFERCCGAKKWVAGMVAARPFADAAVVHAVADDVWALCGPEDYLEAFTHHPRIGDVEGLRKKFASTATWASGEQAGTAVAAEETLEALAQGNRDYEAKFGHIFIVCATGKTADEMLEILRARMPNEPRQELNVAAGEQHKITHLRLEKLLA